MNAVLAIEHDHGDTEAQLFQHGRNHEEPQLDRIGGDHQKCDLPGEGCAYEAVVEARVGDRRGILLADALGDEIQRGNDENPVNTRDPEDDFGESHGDKLPAAGF